MDPKEKRWPAGAAVLVLIAASVVLWAGIFACWVAQ